MEKEKKRKQSSVVQIEPVLRFACAGETLHDICVVMRTERHLRHRDIETEARDRSTLDIEIEKKRETAPLCMYLHLLPGFLSGWEEDTAYAPCCTPR